jgi:hypothetical protein
VCEQQLLTIVLIWSLSLFVIESVEITNKMQPYNRIYYSSAHQKLNMFRAAHRSSSGARNCICSLWFTHTCGDWPLSSLSGKCSKHVEPSMRVVMINSITGLHLVGYFYWFILRCTDPWILNLFVILNSLLRKLSSMPIYLQDIFVTRILRK